MLSVQDVMSNRKRKYKEQQTLTIKRIKSYDLNVDTLDNFLDYVGSMKRQKNTIKSADTVLEFLADHPGKDCIFFWSFEEINDIIDDLEGVRMREVEFTLEDSCAACEFINLDMTHVAICEENMAEFLQDVVSNAPPLSGYVQLVRIVTEDSQER